MKSVVLYFSRTGNTKKVAEAIAEAAESPAFDIASAEPSVVEGYDTIFMGTPVEGANPAKEMLAFVQRLPQTQGKKAVLFTTYRLFGNERTMKKIENMIKEKGYETLLKVTKKVKKPEDLTNLSELLEEVKKIL
jgi:flavodoxin